MNRFLSFLFFSSLLFGSVFVLDMESSQPPDLILDMESSQPSYLILDRAITACQLCNKYSNNLESFSSMASRVVAWGKGLFYDNVHKFPGAMSHFPQSGLGGRLSLLGIKGAASFLPYEQLHTSRENKKKCLDAMKPFIKQGIIDVAFFNEYCKEKPNLEPSVIQEIREYIEMFPYNDPPVQWPGDVPSSMQHLINRLCAERSSLPLTSKVTSPVKVVSTGDQIPQVIFCMDRSGVESISLGKHIARVTQSTFMSGDFKDCSINGRNNLLHNLFRSAGDTARRTQRPVVLFLTGFISDAVDPFFKSVSSISLLAGCMSKKNMPRNVITFIVYDKGRSALKKELVDAVWQNIPYIVVDIRIPDCNERKAIIENTICRQVHSCVVQCSGISPQGMDALAGSTEGLGRLQLKSITKEAIHRSLVYTASLASSSTYVDSKRPLLSEKGFVDNFKESIARRRANMGNMSDPLVWVGPLPDGVSDLILQLKHPDKFDKHLLPRAIFLLGSPGVGKTYLGKCIAQITGSVFLYQSCPAIFNPFLGESERAIRELYITAAKRAREAGSPVIVFLDEFDSIGGARSDAPHYQQSIVNTLLTQLDGDDNTLEDPIITIMASNRDRQFFDTGFVNRPGRVLHIIEMPMPSKQQREELLWHYIQTEVKSGHVAIDFGKDKLDELVGCTEGFSADQLKGAVQSGTICTIVASVSCMDRSEGLPVLTVKAIRERCRTMLPIGKEQRENEQPVSWVGPLPEEVTTLISQILHPERFPQDLLPHGILLLGPPGTGKTNLVRYIAQETKCQYIYISGPSIFDKYWGQSEKRMRDIFDTARKRAAESKHPVIIMLDEFDTIGGMRANDLAPIDLSSGHRGILNTLLTELDGVDYQGEYPVIVFMASNMDRSFFDKALCDRPSRITHIITMPMPDEEGRRILFEHFLHKQTATGLLSCTVEHDALQKLAKETQGLSADQIKGVVAKAAVATIVKSVSDSSYVDGNDGSTSHGSAQKQNVVSPPPITDGELIRQVEGMQSGRIRNTEKALDVLLIKDGGIAGKFLLDPISRVYHCIFDLLHNPVTVIKDIARWLFLLG